MNGQQNIFSHLVAFPRRWVRLALRGRWHHTYWQSALWRSTACPWPGQTLETWESLPPCPDWPVPSWSSLPGTDTSTTLEKHKDNFKSPICLKDMFIIQDPSNMLEESIENARKWRTAKIPKRSLKSPINYASFVPSLTLQLNDDCLVFRANHLTRGQGQRRIKIVRLVWFVKRRQKHKYVLINKERNLQI